MTKEIKITLAFIVLSFIFLIFPTMVNAEDTYTTTSTINGVTINWSYTLNESGQIKNLKCTNPADITGNVTVPSTLEGKTVVSLGDNAFKSAIGITSVTIPNSVTEIEHSAFENCTNLNKVDLGNITTISFDIFKGCTSLTEITIPKTLKNGSTSPSLDNPNITKITLEEGLTVVPPKLCANTGITEIIIPNSVTEIGYCAFEDCPNLSKVDLGTIQSISFDVFKNCPKLTSIKIPKTLVNGTTVNKGVFTGTTVLTSVTFEDGITEIPAGILQGCSGITSVTIPNSVTKINCYAFAGTSITEIEIPNSVIEIQYYAFKDCPNLTKVTILDNCTVIGWFNLYPTTDTIFNNHNDDLTIYCYEGSKIAEYAIGTKIKYIYLTKPDLDTPEEDDKQTSNENSTIEKADSDNNSTTDLDNDPTTAKGNLPYAGVNIKIITVIVLALIGGIFVYFKYNRLKDI